MSTIRYMVNSSNGEDEFMRYISSMNATHILMRTNLVDKYLKDNFQQKEIKRFLKLVKKYWKKVYDNNGYIVWDIQNGLRE